MTGSDDIIKGRGIAQFSMPNGTMIKVDDALYAPRAPRTLLSFKVVRDNDLHIHTYVENGTEISDYYLHKELTYSYCGEV
jgi:peptide/histidine transporter 3/4